MISRRNHARRVALELDHADAAALAAALAVVPRPEHEVHETAVWILRRERLVERRRAVDVLLVEQPADDQHRHRERLFREHAVHRLRLPPGVIGRVRGELAPESGCPRPREAATSPAEPPRSQAS